jgi:hypothetical protein
VWDSFEIIGVGCDGYRSLQSAYSGNHFVRRHE